jgi:glycine/serine hydroxymethyltransferase
MDVLKSKGDAQVVARVKQEVLALTKRFPLS